MTRRTAPLAGLRVLELARILAGPWAGQLLRRPRRRRRQGRSPEGDDTRRWGPPFIERDGRGAAAYFHACNRGKRSVVADFPTEEGRQACARLAAEADVVIENFKLGGLDRFGLGYAGAVGAQPRLVWCSITGFGQDGPYAHRAGYDYIVQGMSGLMSVTGEPEREPQKVGVAVTDIFTGVYAATAILAAIHQRERDRAGAADRHGAPRRGDGGHGEPGDELPGDRGRPARMGNAHPNIVPYQVFACADGHAIVAVGNDGQFRRFCGAPGAGRAGRPTRATPPTPPARPPRRAGAAPADAVTRTPDARRPAGRLRGAGRAGGADQRHGRRLRRPAGAWRGGCGSTPGGVPGCARPCVLGRAPGAGPPLAAAGPASATLLRRAWPPEQAGRGARRAAAGSARFSRTGRVRTWRRNGSGRRTASFSVVTSCAPSGVAPRGRAARGGRA